MSNPYGPPIETTEDWNAALACCCAMPAAPAPTMICESKTATRAAVGWGVQNYRSAFGIVAISPFDPEALDCVELVKTYREVSATVVFSSTHPDSEDSTSNFATVVGANAEYSIFGNPTPRTEDGDTLTARGTGVDNYSEGTFSGTVTTEYEVDEEPFTDTVVTTIIFSNPITAAEVREEALAKLAEIATWTSTGAVCAAALEVNFYICEGEPTAEPANVVATKVRYRWQVPSSHLGTYYKITWDVLFEPTGWDDEEIPEEDRPLRFSRKNLTVEWTGPGSGAQSDPSWLAGDWYDLEVPEEPGERRVINVRFKMFPDAP